MIIQNLLGVGVLLFRMYRNVFKTVNFLYRPDILKTALNRAIRLKCILCDAKPLASLRKCCVQTSLNLDWKQSLLHKSLLVITVN